MVETNIANSQPVSDEYLEKMNAYWRAEIGRAHV